MFHRNNCENTNAILRGRTKIVRKGENNYILNIVEFTNWNVVWLILDLNIYLSRGGSRGGGRTRRAAPPPPLKLEKIWFFCVKSWFFTRNTPNIFAPPSARCNSFKCPLPPNLKSWIRPCLSPCLSTKKQTSASFFRDKYVVSCRDSWK